MNLDYDFVLEYAAKKHAGCFRADGVTPYIEHPKLAAEIVKNFVNKFGREEDVHNLPLLVAAALLHDTMEDSYTSYLELKCLFGDTVAGLVMDATTVDYSKNEKGKTRYLAEKLAAVSDYALVVKLADRMANVIDSNALTLERKFFLRKSTENILKFVEDVRGSYFGDLIKAMFDQLWEELDKHIPYKTFIGTEFEKRVFDEVTYHNPNYLKA